MHNLRPSEAAGKLRAIHAVKTSGCLRSVLEAIPRIYLVDVLVNRLQIDGINMKSQEEKFTGPMSL